MKLLSLSMDIEVSDDLYERLKDITRNNININNTVVSRIIEEHKDEYDSPMTVEDVYNDYLDLVDSYEEEAGKIDSIEDMFKEELKLNFSSKVHENPYLDEKALKDLVKSTEKAFTDNFNSDKDWYAFHVNDNLFWSKIYNEISKEMRIET